MSLEEFVEKLSIYNEFQKRAWSQFIPLNVTLELSLKCNLRCVHCYNFDRSKPYFPVNELTPVEVKRILDEISQEGTLFISFTGGEALAHPHLLDFIKHA